MKIQFQKIVGVLSQKQKTRITLFQLLIIISAFVELATVSVLPAFMLIIGTPDILEKNSKIARFASIFEIASHQELIHISAIATLSVVILGNTFALYVAFLTTRFSAFLGHEFSCSLYRNYLSKDYLFHAAHGSPLLINNVYNEVVRVSKGILNPIMQMNSRIMVAVVLTVNLIIVQPKLTLIIISCLAGFYYLVLAFTRSKLISHGEIESRENQNRYRYLSESFAGIKEIKFLGLENVYSKKYEASSENLARANTANQVIAQSPRYVLETFAFGGMAIIVAYLLRTTNDMQSFLPIVSLYALTGYKLLPAIQQVFSNYTAVKTNFSALERIHSDLQQSKEAGYLQFHKQPLTKMQALKSIKFNDVWFKYPEKSDFALKGINLEIPIGKSVAFVGYSGSGKTTTADILLGILSPASGELNVDGMNLNTQDISAWQQSLSYVPQNIFLIDGSIADNVSLGTHEPHDLLRINSAVTNAGLKQHVDQLPNGLATTIGERGVQLSGGQRQRIAMARALYQDKSVIILDEATSSLDGITEKAVMESLEQLPNDRTFIIIAHRLGTIKHCDIIYFFSHGEIVASGKFQELFEKNLEFKKLVESVS